LLDNFPLSSKFSTMLKIGFLSWRQYTY